MADKIIAKVFRYNPATETKPAYKTYEVPWREWLTVLEVLRYIHQETDPISFDWGCRIARCGTCGVQVNKQPVLSCVTVVSPGEIQIDPLPNLRVVRDLVVDRSQVNQKLLACKPWLERSGSLDKVPEMSDVAYQKVESLQLCLDCLLCHSVCPVVAEKGIQKFAGPNIMMKIAMRFYDPRDEAKEERLQIAVRNGLLECTLCGMCHQVCPQGGLLTDQEPLRGIREAAYQVAAQYDEALARRFYKEPPIDHTTIIKDLQDRAKVILS